jgi:hypothetical protein
LVQVYTMVYKQSKGKNVLNTGDGGDGGGGDDVEQSFFEKNKMYIIGAIVLIGGFIAYKKFYAKKK